MLAETTAVLGAIEAAKRANGFLTDLRAKLDPDNREAMDRLTQVQGAVAQMIAEASTVQLTIMEMKAEIDALQKAKDLRTGYKLAEVSSKTYGRIPHDEDVGSGGLIACPQCFEDERLSVMLPQTNSGIVDAVCAKCRLRLRVDTHWAKYCEEENQKHQEYEAREEARFRSDNW